MKYLAFNTSVAFLAAMTICNYAIAENTKIDVENVAPHVVKLPDDIAETQLRIIMDVAEKYQGYLTDEIPSPISFYDPQPPVPRVKPQPTGYDHAAAAEFAQQRAFLHRRNRHCGDTWLSHQLGRTTA